MIVGLGLIIKPMNWYCIHTKPKNEKLVEHYLQNELGLETYYPRLKRKKTIRRVRHEVLETLFPRYLFCKLDLAESYRAVTYGRDVIEVVSTGDHPTEVSGQTIEHIREWAGSEGDIITLEPERRASWKAPVKSWCLLGVKTSNRGVRRGTAFL